MNLYHGAFSCSRSAAIDVVVVSRVCLFRECISRCLADDYSIHVLDACASRDEAVQSVERLHPDMVLIDARFTGGALTGAELARTGDGPQIVAIALEETEANILAWAEAGATGYIADTATMRDFPQLLRQIRCGGAPCEWHVAGEVPRDAGTIAAEWESRAALALTPRERAIQRHIGAGFSNKDIARALNISVGTTKTHVHNLLGKLGLTSRAQVAAQYSNTRIPHG